MKSEYRYDYNFSVTRYHHTFCLIVASQRSLTKRFKHAAMDIVFLCPDGSFKKERFPINRKNFGFVNVPCRTNG